MFRRGTMISATAPIAHSPFFFIAALFPPMFEHPAANLQTREAVFENEDGAPQSPIPSSQNFCMLLTQAFLFLLALLSHNILGGTEGDRDQASGCGFRDGEVVARSLFICCGSQALCT